MGAMRPAQLLLPPICICGRDVDLVCVAVVGSVLARCSPLRVPVEVEAEPTLAPAEVAAPAAGAAAALAWSPTAPAPPVSALSVLPAAAAAPVAGRAWGGCTAAVITCTGKLMDMMLGALNSTCRSPSFVALLTTA